MSNMGNVDLLHYKITDVGIVVHKNNFFLGFGSFGNEPMRSCSVRRVSSSVGVSVSVGICVQPSQ